MQLTKDNANEDCRKIIELLPNENPSLNELINGCAKAGSRSHNMILLGNSIAAAVRVSPQYCKYKQQGHLKTNCSCKPILTGTNPLKDQGKERLSVRRGCMKTKTSPHLPVAYMTSTQEGLKEQLEWMYSHSTQ